MINLHEPIVYTEQHPLNSEYIKLKLKIDAAPGPYRRRHDAIKAEAVRIIRKHYTKQDAQRMAEHYLNRFIVHRQIINGHPHGPGYYDLDKAHKYLLELDKLTPRELIAHYWRKK